MCNFASGVAIMAGETLRVVEAVRLGIKSHTELFEKFNIRDGITQEGNTAKFEYLPQGRYDEFDRYQLFLDDSRNPKWWDSEGVQAEIKRVMDAAVRSVVHNSGVIEVKEGRLVLLGNATATIHNNATATLCENATATLCENATATLCENATATIYNNASATLYGNATATLYDDATATLYDDATATLYDDAIATLYGNATATLYDNATAMLYDSAIATLYGNATATLYDNAISRNFKTGELLYTGEFWTPRKVGEDGK